MKPTSTELHKKLVLFGTLHFHLVFKSTLVPEREKFYDQVFNQIKLEKKNWPLNLFVNFWINR